MAQYVSCEFCGANLDFGEKCDCIKKEGAPPDLSYLLPIRK